MKKQLLCGALSLTLVFSSLLGFSACSDNSELLDRIDKLEQELESTGTLLDDLQSQISQYNTLISSLENDNSVSKSELQTLKTKVEALEIANLSFTEQIKQLDSASDSYAQDLATLTSNYTALSADVQNATHIERVVVKEEDIGTDKLVKYCSLSSSNSEGELIIGCGIEFSTKLFHYQLLTCEVSVTYNEQTSNISIYLSRADHNSDRIYLNGGTATGIPMTGNAKATVSLIEIVLYRFD